jgi:hypothetical protein
MLSDEFLHMPYMSALSAAEEFNFTAFCLIRGSEVLSGFLLHQLCTGGAACSKFIAVL